MLTKVTYSMISNAPINVADYGVTGNGVADDTVAIQKAINDNPGKTIVFNGMSVISSTIDVPSNDTQLVFAPGAGVSYSTGTMTAISVTGDNVVIDGATINAPASFDALNVQPTYACIELQGNFCRVANTKIENVPKVGVLFTDVEGGYVVNTTINGNFPAASYSALNTGHFGVLIDHGGASEKADFLISGSFISGCMQGVFIGNYGSAAKAFGVKIANNTFHGIFGGAIYGGGSNVSYQEGVVVTGNTFQSCNVTVALTGFNHSIVGNTVVSAGYNDVRDMMGISLRFPQSCVVSGNSMSGIVEDNTAVILLTNISGGVEISGNVISGNSINVTSGNSSAISIGSQTLTEICKNNTVANNVIVGQSSLSSGSGLVNFVMKTGFYGQNNQVTGNTVVNRNPLNGIFVFQQFGMRCSNNTFNWEANASSATTVFGVRLVDVSNSTIARNICSCSADWGDNLTIGSVTEASLCSSNFVSDHRMAVNTTKATVRSPHVNGQSGSGSIFREYGPSAPNLNAGVGSTWNRTDGGAGTTFYVKESGTAASGWNGK